MRIAILIGSRSLWYDSEAARDADDRCVVKNTPQ